MQTRKCIDSFTIKTSIVLPPDTNSQGTMFGGKLMSYIDDVAAIAAMRHARSAIVTASTDSVDFLAPIHAGNSVCLEAFVTYTGTSSMEVIVRVKAEDLVTGERTLCALSFLTMVGIGEDGKPCPVPQVIPETEEEKELFETAKKRAEIRKQRRKESQYFAQKLGAGLPWKKNVNNG